MAKQKQRYRRKLKGDGLVQAWPADAPAPEELAAQARYRGSNEHKARPLDPSYGFDPDLRSDASRCDPSIARDRAEAALKAAIQHRCVSEQFEGRFPRYAWAWIGGRPYIARLINREAGDYKGWPIEELELPADRDQRLAALSRNGDV